MQTSSKPSQLDKFELDQTQPDSTLEFYINDGLFQQYDKVQSSVQKRVSRDKASFVIV